ncbi:bifunctional serine/threonine-protein kinase/formylglycine-generating enzyme family protein [Rivularia sp. UHCC 0363]|uniref:bifunctional serine/threonine-protein kinase/formylglycine-generating enzyme family protein n=1 Tax=Rivularia sp. UHCC 0363 TaxID=3110244 RepID=UPI002B1F8AB8|nr:bifunctional serine/threonine-protein kinase/formylglycine-generating enzyme family protein [Rivularia sp. UHCC 0363]MEA5594124.1 bifunctional serine/threonine-protein kinase/formylglycine-generating enzyme family protein [Rivularia sp. UHCC 0363]
MLICQEPNCSNPFNVEGNKHCISCGVSNFGKFLRNRYRVSNLLGEGGFSKTYAAVDVDRLDAPCVIKQFFPQVQGSAARAKAAKLFREEAFRLYDLGENHWQIPRLLAFFEQGSSLYLVQEFIEGQTLLEEVNSTTFDESAIRGILTDLLPVLNFIHSHNVIHRDIKPENIIRRKVDGKLVLIDFGGAKQVTQTSLARQATVLYTIGYAPAEQMAGFVFPASDLYALGITCVRLLTQCLPLQDDRGQFHDYLYDAMNGEWLWRKILQEKGITISDELGRIFDKLLQHLVKDRYQSATEILEDLNSSVSDKVAASPPQPTLPDLASFEFNVVRVDTVGKEIKRWVNRAKFFTDNLSSEIILEMVLIPGGSFIMGSSIVEGDTDERPQHIVTLKPFFMGKYPVTQAQWKAVASLPQVNCSLNPSPSKFKGANLPVENVSWHEVQEFCARLQKQTGRQYRLPSEAEWEYACRAGTSTPFHFGKSLNAQLVNCNIDNYHPIEAIAYRQTTPVGSFGVANDFGLYDMHGQVWEWCADPWHKNYKDAPTDGTVWQLSGDVHRRVLRGGSWSFSTESCRSASRSWNEPEGGLRVCGFRVAMSS